MSTRSTSLLLLVDIQHDFLPGGALAVADGDAILGPTAALIRSGRFDHVLATQDWHPPGHVSFASSHSGHAPFDTIELYGHTQVLWPDHCVAGSPGAALSSALPLTRIDGIVRKGTDPRVDSYSGFRNNWDAAGKRPLTGLGGYVRELAPARVFVCGLARDYCVKWTAEDAAELGFDTTVIWDLTRAVDRASDAAVRAALAGRGVRLVDAAALAGDD